MIEFNCPGCGKKFAADSSLAGKAAKCNACGQRMQVPAASSDDQAAELLASPEVIGDRPSRRNMPPMLRPCHDCGKMVSLRAVQCPDCGAPLGAPGTLAPHSSKNNPLDLTSQSPAGHRGESSSQRTDYVGVFERNPVKCVIGLLVCMVLIPACVALLVNARSKNGSAGGTSTASSPANMTAIDTAKKAQSKPKGPAFVPDGVTEVEKTINGRHVLCLFPRYRAPYGRAMSPGEAAGAMQQAIFEADRLTKRKLQAEESGQYDEVQIQGQ